MLDVPVVCVLGVPIESVCVRESCRVCVCVLEATGERVCVCVRESCRKCVCERYL